MSDHTPDTEEVAYYYEGPDLDAGDRRAAFERWLAETIRQAKDEAWEECSDEFCKQGIVQVPANPYAEEATDV